MPGRLGLRGTTTESTAYVPGHHPSHRLGQIACLFIKEALPLPLRYRSVYLDAEDDNTASGTLQPPCLVVRAWHVPDLSKQPETSFDLSLFYSYREV